MKLKELTDICKRLNKANVDYVLVGGFAILIHGFERTTQDVDLIVDAKKENVQRIKDALHDLLPEACDELTFDDVEYGVVVRMVGEDMVIDLIKKIGDIDYAEVSKGVMIEEIEGVKIPVANLDMMLELKKGLREQDKRDYLFLQGKKRFLDKG